MEGGSQFPMPLPPGGPSQNVGARGGQDKEQTSEQMMDLADTAALESIFLLDTQTGQIGQDEQDQREIAVTSVIPADFIVIHSQMFAVGKILFNVPARSRHRHQPSERSRLRGKDQGKGDAVWLLQKAT